MLHQFFKRSLGYKTAAVRPFPKNVKERKGAKDRIKFRSSECPLLADSYCGFVPIAGIDARHHRWQTRCEAKGLPSSGWLSYTVSSTSTRIFLAHSIGELIMSIPDIRI